MKKHGVELSMNVIIIAAIALIILVLLVLLVTGKFQDLVRGTGCKDRFDGTCEKLADQSCTQALGEGYQSAGRTNCAADETCCYKPLGGTQ